MTRPSLIPAFRTPARALCLGLCLLLLAACGGPQGGGNAKVPAGAKSSGGMHATITTDKGDITIEFLPADAPRAVENFRLLAEHDYYNGLTFHRVVRGFMIQGGDPNGDGTGGQSAWGPPFQDEITPTSMLYQEGYVRGVVAMANSGPNTNGSQFFIMHRDYPLPPNYVIFAHVIDGMDTVDTIAAVDVTYVNGEQSKPITPVLIQKVTVKP